MVSSSWQISQKAKDILAGHFAVAKVAEIYRMICFAADIWKFDFLLKVHKIQLKLLLLLQMTDTFVPLVHEVIAFSSETYL